MKTRNKILQLITGLLVMSGAIPAILAEDTIPQKIPNVAVTICNVDSRTSFITPARLFIKCNIYGQDVVFSYISTNTGSNDTSNASNVVYKFQDVLMCENAGMRIEFNYNYYPSGDRTVSPDTRPWPLLSAGLSAPYIAFKPNQTGCTYQWWYGALPD